MCPLHQTQLMVLEHNSCAPECNYNKHFKHHVCTFKVLVIVAFWCTAVVFQHHRLKLMDLIQS
jgi:hypothetical protein